MGKLNNIWSYLARHKYLITIVVGLVIVGVVDENSFRKYAMHKIRINELNEEIAHSQEMYSEDSVALSDLLRNNKGAERIARERYLMKRPNEEIFIMRDRDIFDE